jgi:thermostable 8-oxoguanine DNA glycosylase
MSLPKLLIIGHGRHGKDTVCEILRDSYGFSFESSSQFCSKLFIFDQLKDQYGYKTEEECYADRHNHRAEWYDAICAYNVPDASTLGREIFLEHDIYCGLRNKKEYHAMRNTGVFDYAIWVDRSDYLPEEDTSSMSLKQWMADFTIDNNGTLEELHFNTHQLINHLLKVRS